MHPYGDEPDRGGMSQTAYRAQLDAERRAQRSEQKLMASLGITSSLPPL